MKNYLKYIWFAKLKYIKELYKTDISTESNLYINRFMENVDKIKKC